MKLSGTRIALALSASAALHISPVPSDAKKVEGRIVLAARQARVVAKFCYDFSKECTNNEGSLCDAPGMFDAEVFTARHAQSSSATSSDASVSKPEVYVALLDDEYYSFPKLSQVWDDANCTDVLHASKRSVRINWDQASLASPGDQISSRVVEKLRPRWWHIAIVSCSSYGVEMSYRMHFTNPLRGWQHEFSMDAMGVKTTTWGFCVLFGYLTSRQVVSVRQWLDICREGSGGILRLHPALLLLTSACCLATLGEVFWLVYYWDFQACGEVAELLALLGRASIVSAKTLISILLLLLAHGECVCSPDISWSQHRELVTSIALFGFLSFGLEIWGDSELRSSTTEYIYDTRPGIALVAFDVIWLWLYASRSLRTFQGETRARPRLFYRRCSPWLAFWFAALPLVAALASVLASWVRFWVTYLLNGLVHVMALAVLVHTFHPAVAAGLYDLRAQEFVGLRGKHRPMEDVDRGMLGAADDEML